MDDLLQSGNDKMATDPADLARALVAVMTISAAKQLAGKNERPWTDKLESKLQERSPALVGAAKKRGR